jgi:hypothetical protein
MMIDHCEGASAMLTAEGLLFYMSTGETCDHPGVTLSTQYYVTVTNADGCRDTSQTIILI